MQTLALERETLNKEPEYCHIMCCHPTISLCGAFKPVRCDSTIFNSTGNIEYVCPVCGKEVCPDCLNLIYSKCSWC